MAAEHTITPTWAADQADFASAWLAAWIENDGKIGAHPRVGRFISFPMTGRGCREQFRVQRTLLGMLDLAGPAARDAVFAAAAREG